MKLDVECYSGRKGDERPVRFALDGRHYDVQEVLDQWYEPASTCFKLLASDRNLYILRQHTSTPGRIWELISFRQNAQ